MSKNTLELLFDSKPRVKILKLLFRNSDRGFEVREIASRVQESQQLVRRELKKFLSIGLLKVLNHEK